MVGSVIYRIDAEDRITEVNDEWRRFAEGNGGDPDPATVLGRPLWDFILDDGNRSIYRSMVHTVRRKVTPLLIPFRCDSPSEERHMTMTLAPGYLSEVVFICALQYAFDIPAERSSVAKEERTTIVECDGCHRIRTERGWQDCWDVIVAKDIEIDDRAITVLHTRCPNC